MPIYTYRCHECRQEFDYKQGIKEPALTICPEDIQKEHNHEVSEVSRVISKSIGLVFKGSGFYLTDYKKKNASAATTSTDSANIPNTETKSESAKQTA
jgi:putative FmdB family regulatory protein